MSNITISQTTASKSDLKVISYSKIVQGDADELDTLRKACEEHGFWYLDLNSQNGDPISVVQNVPSVFKIVEEFFDLEDAEKTRYDVDEIGPWKLNGYVSPWKRRFSQQFHFPASDFWSLDILRSGGIKDSSVMERSTA